MCSMEKITKIDKRAGWNFPKTTTMKMIFT